MDTTEKTEKTTPEDLELVQELADETMDDGEIWDDLEEIDRKEGAVLSCFSHQDDSCTWSEKTMPAA